MPCIRYAILPLNTDYREDDGTIRYSILGYYVIECQLLKTIVKYGVGPKGTNDIYHTIKISDMKNRDLVPDYWIFDDSEKAINKCKELNKEFMDMPPVTFPDKFKENIAKYGIIEIDNWKSKYMDYLDLCVDAYYQVYLSDIYNKDSDYPLFLKLLK